MKCIVQKNDLAGLINKIQHVVSNKPILPILRMLTATADHGMLTLSATDLTLGVICSVPAVVIDSGKTTIPAKHFAHLVKEISYPTLELCTNEHDITEIKAGDSLFKLMGTNFAEYPHIPIVQNNDFIALSTKHFKDILYRISFSASRDESRPTLAGMWLKLDVATLSAIMVCTDGKRLAKAHLELLDTHLDRFSDIEVIIPIKSIDELYKMLPNGDNSITKISITHDRISFETEDSILITKVIDGKYPNVNQVIPNKIDCPIKISLNRDELTMLLRQVALFTSDVSQSVCFSFDNGELSITANTAELGEGKVKTNVVFDHDMFSIAFNPHFFLGVLRHGRSEDITIYLSDAHSPCLICDDTSAMYLLMPMRVNT